MITVISAVFSSNTYIHEWMDGRELRMNKKKGEFLGISPVFLREQIFLRSTSSMDHHHLRRKRRR